MSASVVSPEMKPVETTIRQVAPGRCVGEFDASQTGSYVAMISPGLGRAPILSGVECALFARVFRYRAE